MKLTEEQRKEFEAAARPLMEWLAKSFHPHVAATVSGTDAELTEGIARVKTLDYVRD